MTTPKHYQLTNQEWLELCVNLSYAEVKVLIHLRTIDPFADRFKEADTKQIANALGITQRTVQRALCSLATKELIDLEFTGFRFRLRSKLATSTSPSDTYVATSTSPSDTYVATSTSPSDTQIASRDIHVAETTPMSPKRHTDRDRTPEPLSGKGSEASHTINTLQTLKKEEREIAMQNSKPVENSPSWDEPQDFESHLGQSQNGSSKGQNSAPPSPQIFNFESFNWQQYDKAGAGGSDPQYFAWAIAQVTQYSDAKVAQGKPAIGDIQRYTLATIQNRGAVGYRKYLEAQGLAPPYPPTSPSPQNTLTWQSPTSAEVTIHTDLSDHLATIQAHLRLKQWDWSHPQLQLWVCMAQDTAKKWQWPPIEFQPKLGCSNWPDWAIAKLAADLVNPP